MKKLISVLLSITLAVLCFSSLVISADTAETAQDGRSYVIWDADPTKVSTEDGANAKPNVESWEEALRPRVRRLWITVRMYRALSLQQDFIIIKVFHSVQVQQCSDRIILRLHLPAG